MFLLTKTFLWYGFLSFCKCYPVKWGLLFLYALKNEISSWTVLKVHARLGPIRRKNWILDSFWQKLFIGVFPVKYWHAFSGFDPLDRCLFLLFGSKVLNGNVILVWNGVTNLSRPPFETTSWHPLYSASAWLLDDNMDTLLPRGSKNTWASPQMHFFRWKSSFHRRFQIYVKRSPTLLRLRG